MELTESQVMAIKRKRGELDLSITTFKKLNDWLIDEYETTAQHETSI